MLAATAHRMNWLEATDIALFHFVNQSLANPVLDRVMPCLAGHPLFVPVVLAAALVLAWKGGRRARLCVLLLALVILLGDPLVCNTVKKAVGRPRPGIALADSRALLHSSASGSMPSGHAANWFAATVVCLVFYRRSWRLLLPAATAVAFSRVYCGVHYPSDVVAGAILGAGYAAAGVWAADGLWRWAGPRWFPLWWRSLPSLVRPEMSAAGVAGRAAADCGGDRAEADRQWLRLGYLCLGALLLFRLGYIASGRIELSKDEAYQWVWSKHLALSYYSKPPGIALIQWAGTALWGDSELGVRFFSPVFAALLGLVLLRFLAREVGARQGFVLLAVSSSVPLLALGAVLLTVDSPLVLCWTLALVAGWRAAQPDGTTRQWLGVGAALGLGFLSKYSAAYQIACWALFFALWPPARVHLRRPGPYLALLVMAVATLPVVLWNAQHGWATAEHLADRAAWEAKWRPTLRYCWDFLGAELGLLNPVFLVGAVWAMGAFWRRRRERPLWLYLFCMGAPVFLGHLAYSLRTRILPNWIAPAVLPMFGLMVLYWDERSRAAGRAVRAGLAAGLLLGGVALVGLHESNLIGKLAGRPLPPEVDPLRRVRAWKETAAVVETARRRLEAEGPPAFLIADHYGMTGLFTFYLPAARTNQPPLVYPRSFPVPNNQFYFWPEYRYREQRRGHNAIYVAELGPYPLEKGWLVKWLGGHEVRHARIPPPAAAPATLLEEFETVTNLGIHEVTLRGRVFRRVQLFACRHLR